MTSVDYFGIHSVINKEDFQNNVLVEDCPNVGRSLVAKRPLAPGDIVLVEEPLIQYDLKPTCRSSKSPYYSKRLWKLITTIVQDIEKREEDETSKCTEDIKKKVEQGYESYDEDDNDSEDEDEDEDAPSNDSDFCPGVPAAIIAYLNIHPPKSYNNVQRRQTYKQKDFDFFYYPNTDTEPHWLDHKTIRIIHTVTQKVVDTIPLYSHVDPFDLRSFVLKIYSNAHTVLLPRNRTLPTHSAKRARRAMYKHKFGEDNYLNCYWGNEEAEAGDINTPTIALLRWGSKFAHSCSPNLFLRFEPARNAMIFTVIRPLKEGDILSFSYLPEDESTLGGLICGTTMDRQAKLEKFKFFKCTCERCVDWDWSRGVACKNCNQPVNYRNQHGIWTCFACQAQVKDDEASFIGERENNVQVMVMNFISRINGNRSMNEGMMRMLEPYLLDLLDPSPEKNKVPVPKNHWVHGIIHSLLSFYHLVLFPQSFGKGLASQLGLTMKGLEEALIYIEFLNLSIRTRPNPKNSLPNGNPMAAFFAGWRILSLVIDLVMESTENKYANIVYDKYDSDSDEESVPNSIEKDQSITKSEKDSEPVLIPLAEEWVAPVTKISNIVNNEWIPLIEQIFQSQQAPVVEDMLRQIKAFAVRVEKTKSMAVAA
ncbi:uncharacterized protein BX663DRAFT_549961 [Cokeromyces recurvatus]|uniref:uncharacterized protein n=1 Tax=Cokeromyces recurvatus TaxID=90255 RepID=UPI002220ED74|nr:uncharacterized protein BX663DRAFT_549961 [Cokeromyces recurvatus]KAI7905115.1 hypothetical protein BX663DRAFT_549961 [Cokeromyces recurvatus]